MTAPGNSRDITVDVTIRSDTKGAKAGAAALGDIDKAAGDAGKSMRGMEVDSRSLAGQIDKSKETVRGLEAELTKVGNNPGLRKSLRVERSWLAELERIRKALPGSNPVAGVTSGISGLGPAVQSSLLPALIGAAALATPMIGAMIGGAVAGGIGTVGVAAGVLSASRDSSVKAAFADLGNTAKESFFAGGEVFVEPVLRSVGVLKRAVSDIQIGDTFAKAAPSIEIIATGLADLIRNVMPGVNAAFARLTPFAEVAAEGFGDLGKALSGFIDDATRSPGAVEGLKAAFMAVEGTVVLLGKGIYALSEAFHWILNTGQSVAVGLSAFAYSSNLLPDAFGDSAMSLANLMSVMSDVPSASGGVARSFSNIEEAAIAVATKADPFIGYLYDARKAVEGLDGALQELFGVQMTMDDATLRWSEDILRLTEATREHGTSTRDNTKEGLENQRMIQGLIGDAMKLRDATYEQTGSVDVANQAYQRQIDKLKDVMKNLGFTKEQIDKMVGDYNINVNVNTNYRTSGSYSQAAKNLAHFEPDFERRASGGPVMAGVPYRINERGYETVTFPAGGEVHPASLTPMMGAGSTGNLAVQLSWASSGQRLVDALMEALRIEVQGLGGPDKAFN